MVYHTGQDVLLIATTEDTTNGLTTGSVQAVTASMDICSLHADCSASAKQTNVTGITYDFGRIRNEQAVFGQKTRLNYPIKYTWTLTMTRPKNNDAWSRAYDTAPAGLSGSTVAVFNGMDNPVTNSGYRINVQVLAAGENTPWLTGYGGVMSSYTTDKNPDDVVFESVTFTGNQWAPFATASFAPRTSVY